MNAMELHHLAFRCLSLLSLMGDGIARAEAPDPTPSVRFSYEGQSELTGSPIFPGPTTDYYWGEVQKHETIARHQRHRVYPSDPQNASTYTASFAEWFTLDAQTILVFIETIEFNTERPPQSIEEAKTLLEQPFPTSKKHMRRYFETVSHSAQEKLLRGFSILGMTPEGPIWKMCEPTPVGDGRQTLFAYSAPDGTEYRFEFDRNLFRKCSMSSGQKQSSEHPASTREPLVYESDGPPQGFLYTGEIIDDRTGMTLIATSAQDTLASHQQITRITERVFNFETNRDDPISMICTPGDDEKIESAANPQLQFKWKNGKIEKVVNQPVVQDAAQSQFIVPPRHSWMNADTLIAIAVVSMVAWMSRKRSIPSSQSCN